MKEVRRFRLDNGLRVFLKKNIARTVFAKLRINHGALNERKGEEGMAHFLEHVVLGGGTRKYSPQAQEELSDIFGDVNASTDLLETHIYAGFIPKHTGKFLDFAAESAFAPRLDAAVLDEERQRVLREVARARGTPDFEDRKEYIKALSKDEARSYFILGDEKVVGGAAPDDLREFHARGYSPNNSDLILVGDLPAGTEKLVQKYFSGVRRGAGKRVELSLVAPLKKRTILHTAAPDLLNKSNPANSNSQMDIGFNVPEIGSPDSVPLAVLSGILGGGKFSSRLMKRVSRKDGLAYGISSAYRWRRKWGHFAVGGKVHAPRQQEAIDAVFEEFAKLKKKKVGLQELESAKTDIAYSFQSSYYNNSHQAHLIGVMLEYGISYSDRIKKMMKVTAEEVIRMANRYLPEKSGKYVVLLRDPLKKG